MLDRIKSAVIILGITIPCVLFCDTIFHAIAMTLFSVRAVFEALRCFGFHKNIGVSIPLYIACALPMGAYFLDNALFFKIALTSIFFVFFLVMSLSSLQIPRPEYKNLAAASMLSLFAVSGFTALEIMGVAKHGFFILFFTYVASWATDCSAFFVGRFFGKHKLCPELSPKKTVEGFVGGVIIGSTLLVLLVLLFDIFAQTVEPNYIMVAITALITTVVSQAGDLCFSAIKRDTQIKDFGKLLPGHGGILDRFDSTFAVAIALLFLLNFHNLF